MKRFLPLLMLTGLLLGQEVLNLKSGESFDGAFYGKVGEDIVFKIEGETSTKKFSINDVNTIVTKNGELTYPVDIPIDIPTKKENPSFGQDVLLHKSGEFYNGRYVKKVDELIVFQVEGENHFTPFPINDVAIIKTSNWGELTYPFNIPRKAYSNYKRISPEAQSVLYSFLGAAGCYLLAYLLIMSSAAQIDISTGM